MSAAGSPAEWAGTRDDMHDLHRFHADQQARCDPTIRTHSRNLGPEHDRTREPYMRLRTREEIEAGGFGDHYHFCPTCDKETER